MVRQFDESVVGKRHSFKAHKSRSSIVASTTEEAQTMADFVKGDCECVIEAFGCFAIQLVVPQRVLAEANDHVGGVGIQVGACELVG